MREWEEVEASAAAASASAQAKVDEGEDEDDDGDKIKAYIEVVTVELMYCSDVPYQNVYERYRTIQCTYVAQTHTHTQSIWYNTI